MKEKLILLFIKYFKQRDQNQIKEKRQPFVFFLKKSTVVPTLFVFLGGICLFPKSFGSFSLTIEFSNQNFILLIFYSFKFEMRKKVSKKQKIKENETC
jgi:hypothetical protein